jgi:starch synthase
MRQTFEIVIIAGEMVPFCKTGGLADVVGALPHEIAKLGPKVTAIIPYYRKVAEWAEKNHKDLKIVVDHLPFFLPGYTGSACVRELIDESGVRVLFVDYPSSFDREELYTESGQDYPDNLMRFSILSKAALEACKALDIKPDILNAHDWQAAISVVYLRTHYKDDPFFRDTKSVLTIHNLGYQGRFPGNQFPALDLPWDYFNPDALEYFGQVNVLKCGIIFADQVTTVSPTYALEIQTPEQGAGLDGLLQASASKLSGILNGVEYSDWDPRNDSFIAKKFWIDSLEGKKACKTALRKEFKLPETKGLLFGMVGRLAEQKGLELVTEAIPDIVKMGCQLVLLGTGDPRYHEVLEQAALKYPENIAVKIGFSNALAHQIEAGADMFLMPSRYEPCGLNQMYSLRYGTIPVVTSTGGLKDTVDNVTAARLEKGKATGYVIKDFTTASLVKALKSAVKLHKEEPEKWHKLVVTAMQKDFSWPKQAKKYVELFGNLIESKEPAATK